MRLINADSLKEDFKHRLEKAKKWKENALNKCDDELVIRADAHIDFICEVIMTINNAPTVDAIVNTIEVRPHGEWITFPTNHSIIQCPECTALLNNLRVDVFKDKVGKMNFCPNCGANMRGGAE